MYLTVNCTRHWWAIRGRRSGVLRTLLSYTQRIKFSIHNSTSPRRPGNRSSTRQYKLKQCMCNDARRRAKLKRKCTKDMAYAKHKELVHAWRNSRRPKNHWLG
ncbi:hypothetical protein Fot_12450 [Forsythia ovata]|uniref:Uncharacterized protein n=1 Tax=Forsythia ovata TaxID=205694 RepID=A0ABD1WMJ7_9LAMI